MVSIGAEGQKIHPLTQAMLDGYDELLRQNPKDWFTLYERASQYYRLNFYDKALTDILRCIELTPSKEKGQRASEHSLAADIYTQMGEYSNALSQINAALEDSPGAYTLIYQKGNICLYLGQIDEARKCFNSMLRLKSRSQEAVFGLAKCAIIEGDASEARSYMEQAEKADPSNFITYCRIGDLYSDMGEIQNAAAAYLSAFSLNSKDDRSLTSLLALGKKDYAATIEALDYALGKTSNIIPLLFLKGNIAKEANKPNDAYDAYSKLLSTSEGNTPEVLVTMAEICRDRNSITEALGYADRALQLSSNLSNKLLKASLEYDLGNYELASKMCDEILEDDSENFETLLLASECALALNNYPKAAEFLNLAIGINPLDIRALLLRGYIADNFDITTLPGKSDFVRASYLEVSDDTGMTLKAIAQMLAGKNLDALETMKPIFEKQNDAEANYLSALFYSSIRNIEKGKSFLQQARKLGFENIYLLDTYNVPVLSISPLR